MMKILQEILFKIKSQEYLKQGHLMIKLKNMLKFYANL
jgi:hypothetical protein